MLTIVIILAFMFLYLTWKRNMLVKSVDKLNKILYVDKNPDEYIKECDFILMKPQSQRDRAMNLLQKSTGLFYAGKFEEVEDLLNNQIKRIPPNSQHIFYHDLLLSMMLNGETDEAHKILLDVDEVLAPFKQREDSKMGIEFIYAVDDFYQGKYEQRKEFFEDISENGRNEYRRALGNYFLGLIYVKQGNEEKANECFDKASTLGANSFIIDKISELKAHGDDNEQ